LSRPRGNEWLHEEIEGWVVSEVEVIVSLLTDHEISDLGLTDESEFADELGIQFISYPIPDYDVPVSATTFRSLIHQLSELLSSGKSIGIHCRQGIGRSSLLAACLLSYFNVSVDEAFRQIRTARRTSVPDTAEQRQWVNTFSDRIKDTAAEHHVS
jgi:protein-tyrosine phosphatase